MIFTQAQIDSALRMIEFQHIFFVAANVTTDVLSSYDKQILEDYGIDWQTLRDGWTPFEQSFYFGRLASVLGPAQSQKVTYDDLMKYLTRGQFVPLSDVERATLKYLETKTYGYIKGLGQTIASYVSGSIEDEDFARRDAYENAINDATKRAIIERDTAASVMSEIGHKTNDWSRDLGRIAETEMQNAYEHGKAISYKEKFGGDARVYYKQVYPGACRHCIRLYLTGGIGSEPRLFTYEELLANGTNIGRRADDWLPVLGTVHPYCRCDLRVKRHKDDRWNEKKGIFEPVELDDYLKGEGKIKIEVGDKTMYV